MSKWCLNYESGKYEHIDRNGFSIESGTFVHNWDDSEYRREEEERRREEENNRFGFGSFSRNIIDDADD